MPTTDRNWSAERVRGNFRIDAFSGVMAGVYLGVTVAFLPVVVRRMGGSAEDVALVVAGPFVGHLFSPVFGYLLAKVPPVRVTAITDRKSTRLNSSHQIISYAVFCLKKKKNEC